MFRLIIVLAVVALLSGCSSVKMFKGIPVDDKSSLIVGVPPIRQTSNVWCGPACLFAVAKYWQVDTRAVVDQGLSDGSLGRDFDAPSLADLAKLLGLKAFAFTGSMEDLSKNVEAGRPVLVMLPKPPDPTRPILGVSSFAIHFIQDNMVPRGKHWIVALGVLHNGDVVAFDPVSGWLVIERPAFSAWWNKTQRTCLLLSR